jgi:hypothetical protein
VHGRSTALLSFFALFHTVTGVLTLGAQTFLTRRALHRLGVAGSVGVLPLAILVSSAFAAIGSVGAVILRGSAAIIGRSLYRSAYELLFTPLPDARRRSWKTIIDVGFERFGSAIGGALLLALLAVSSRNATSLAVASLVVLSVIALVLLRRLHVGYVTSLEGRLRAGVAEAPLIAIEGDEALFSHDDAPPPSRDPVLEATLLLRSGSRERVVGFLAREQPLDPALIPHVVALLAHDDLEAPATAALRRGFERGVGQLVDTLIDPNVPVVVRRRIARALRTSTSQRTFDGLVDALRDDTFEVRYESGRSMLAMLERTPALYVSERRILAAVQNEIAVDRHVWETRAAMTSPRVRQSFEHVFTLLSFVQHDDAVRLASRALDTKDRELRGTALEYLETVLPVSLRLQLWPYVDRTNLV